MGSETAFWYLIGFVVMIIIAAAITRCIVKIITGVEVAFLNAVVIDIVASIIIAIVFFLLKSIA